VVYVAEIGFVILLETSLDAVIMPLLDAVSLLPQTLAADVAILHHHAQVVVVIILLHMQDVAVAIHIIILGILVVGIQIIFVISPAVAHVDVNQIKNPLGAEHLASCLSKGFYFNF